MITWWWGQNINCCWRCPWKGFLITAVATKKLDRKIKPNSMKMYKLYRIYSFWSKTQVLHNMNPVNHWSSEAKIMQMCRSRKYPYPHHGGNWKFRRGGQRPRKFRRGGGGCMIDFSFQRSFDSIQTRVSI